MGLEKFRTDFLELPREARIRALCALAHELTIAARDAYDVGEDGGDSVRLRAFNELLHRVTSQLRGHIARDPDIYPEHVFWDILGDYASDCGEVLIGHALRRALRSATSGSPHAPTPKKAAK